MLSVVMLSVVVLSVVVLSVVVLSVVVLSVVMLNVVAPLLGGRVTSNESKLKQSGVRYPAQARCLRSCCHNC